MMKNKTIKKILWFLVIVVVYIIGSLMISPHNTFIHIGKIVSVPKEKAIANKTFIEVVEPNIVYTNKMNYSFYVYKYDFSYSKSYGGITII
ncbi:hypothetical protein [Myroides sp. C15-4]|uniref:hypothetical protein n=1 Tax=Myroides sp. C15-4 TaxID=3400532 RepID=UPI003D2F6098